jgi:hypothetical protein
MIKVKNLKNQVVVKWEKQKKYLKIKRKNQNDEKEESK